MDVAELTRWLTAQIEYDEAELIGARVHQELPAQWADWVQRELEWQRLLVNALTIGPNAYGSLKVFAQRYADRPGYRDEWRPDQT